METWAETSIETAAAIGAVLDGMIGDKGNLKILSRITYFIQVVI